MSESRRGSRTDRMDASETLLLKAAGCLEAEPSLTAWRAFRERVKEGDENIVARRLLPLVCRNLLKLGHPGDPYLSRAYAQSLGANARMVDEAARALLALHEASIKTMVLKGTALLLVHYRDLGARPMADVDILVPESEATDALDALEAVGWRGDPSRRWLKTESHAGTVVSPSGLCVDLHRHATYEARFTSADEGFFEDSVPLDISGALTSAMSTGDQLLHTVIHGQRWSIARSPIWVIDAATLLRAGGVHIQKTVARAASLRLCVGLRHGLETMRQVLGSEEGLEALLGELGADPERSRRVRLSTASEHIEHWFRVREPTGFLGALPNLWFAYRRSGPSGQAPLSGFASFLSNVWRLGPNQSLGRLMLAKARRRLRSRF